MASTTELYKDTDWQQSSGPILSRQIPEGDIWPVGLGSDSGGGHKDVLENGMHPIVAIGPKADRAAGTPVGVVMTLETVSQLAQVNVAPGVMVRQYVANVLTYNGGNPATFDQSLTFGEPVYVDDSNDLAVGVTISRSPLNDAGNANPLAGWIWYAQDEYLDIGVGGPNAAAGLPVTALNSLDYKVLCILSAGCK